MATEAHSNANRHTERLSISRIQDTRYELSTSHQMRKFPSHKVSKSARFLLILVQNVSVFVNFCKFVRIFALPILTLAHLRAQKPS